MSKKALEMGLITQKQYNNLPPALLEAIAKKKLSGVKPTKKKKSKMKKK